MATVQIADIYDPQVFASVADEVATEKNAFIKSGVMVDDPIINGLASQGGTIGTLTHYGPLATTDPNLSSDDPAVKSTPQKITKQNMLYRVAALNQSWSAMDLARDLAAKDPVTAITNKIGGYWATQKTKRLVASAIGILADNVANDSGDMVYNIALDTSAAIADAERISSESIIIAAGTLGDQQDAIGAIAVHSVIYNRLQRLNLIDFIRDADNNILFAQYLGKILIVDDALPAVMGANRITYTSILFGMDSIAHGNGRVTTPSELQRVPDSGNGGGETVLYSRVNEIIAPVGFSFLSASVAGKSASIAELKLATNWNRIWGRKNARIAFLKTNG